MPSFEHMFRDDPGYSLDDALSDASQDYETEFEQFWGIHANFSPRHLTQEQQGEFRDLFHLSKKIAQGAARLLRPPKLQERHLRSLVQLNEEAQRRRELAEQGTLELSEPELQSLIEARGFDAIRDLLRGHWWVNLSDPRMQTRFYKNCLELEAWRLFPSFPGPMAERLQELMKYMTRAPGERVARYLARVAECYVRGMPTEFAVMCRAVMDAALEEIAPDDAVRQRFGIPRTRRVPLERRLEFCGITGALSKKAFDAADEVKSAGDTAVHVLPGLEPALHTLLERLYDVLLEVDRHRRS